MNGYSRAELEPGFALGPWRVLPLAGVVEGPEGRVHVEPKVMDVLLCLAGHAGQVVTRQMLLDEVWNPVIVSDDSLTRCISELRALLGDTKAERQYIRTVPKRGYMLVQAVQPLTRTDGPSHRWAIPRRRLAMAATLCGLLLAAVLLASKEPPPGGAAEAARGARADGGTAGQRQLATVAVLPFVNLSGNPAFEAFTQGLTEDIRNTLLTSSNLRVAGRTSSRAYLDRAIDIREIGAQLGVDALLEGTVRVAGERVRVTAQLSDSREGYPLWADAFERDLGEPMQAQVEIAGEVVGRLLPAPGALSGQAITDSRNLKSHEYTLLGRHHWHQRTAESLQQAIRLFEQARTLDEAYAPALAGLSDALVFSAIYGAASVPEVLARADPLARRALELAPDLAEAHASLGLVLELRGDQAARDAYQRAVDLQPNYSMARMWLGNAWMEAGDLDRARKHYAAALALDPLHPQVQSNHIDALLAAGDLQQASADAARFHRVTPGPDSLALRLKVMAQRGHYRDALNLALGQNFSAESWHHARHPVVESLIRVGRFAEAREMLATGTAEDHATAYLRVQLALAERDPAALRRAVAQATQADSALATGKHCKRAIWRIHLAKAGGLANDPAATLQHSEELLTALDEAGCDAAYPAQQVLLPLYAARALQHLSRPATETQTRLEFARRRLDVYRARGWNSVELALAEFALEALQGRAEAAGQVLESLAARDIQPWALIRAEPLFDDLADSPAMLAARQRIESAYEVQVASCEDIGLTKLGL